MCTRQTWRLDQDLQGGTGLNIFLINSHEAVFQCLFLQLQRRFFEILDDLEDLEDLEDLVQVRFWNVKML